MPADEELHLTLSTEPYILRGSRAAGERDLAALAEEGGEEGVWLYSADQGLWFNLTQESEAEDARMRVAFPDVDISCLGRRLTLYHTHPRAFAERLFEEEWTIFRGSGSFPEEGQMQDAYAKGIRKYCLEQMALPSVDDVMSFAEIRGAYPESELDFRIVSPVGVTRARVIPEPEMLASVYAQLYGERNGMDAGKTMRSISGTLGGMLSLSLR